MILILQYKNHLQIQLECVSFVYYTFLNKYAVLSKLKLSKLTTFKTLASQQKYGF